jgi:peptide/nickel transport system permease protein
MIERLEPMKETPRSPAVPVPTAGRALRLLRHARSNWLLTLGVVIVALSLLLAMVGPHIAPYDPEFPSTSVSSPPPAITEVPGLLWDSIAGSRQEPVHWFGTDSAGLDVFSRVIAAPRVDVVVAVTATVLSFMLGSFLGLIAGYYRNWITDGVTRLSDVLQAFPVFILAMIFVGAAGRSETNIVLTLAILYTPIFLRLTRSRVVSERTRTYVEGARAIGFREISIAVRHVLPNAIAPSLVQVSVTIGWAIILTAGLSFVGAGVRPPTPEWGGMIASGAEQIVIGKWWPSVFPGIAISLMVFGYAAVGNVLQERYAQRGR